MNLILTRDESRKDGIFSTLTTELGAKIATTLEHAYDDGKGGYKPKLPKGTYICKRGPHRLPRMVKNFETFEIMNVPGHTGILFHVGNYNKDSDGCVLVGTNKVTAPDGAVIIVQSRSAFQKFMDLQVNVNEFTLTVK